MTVPDSLTVRIEKPVHGGYGLARHDGRVILVRHGAPGELVKIRVRESKKVWRADVVEVLEPHPGRVEVPWEDAGPGGVGAELAHLDLASQRHWKHDVIDDAMARIGKLSLPIRVNAVDNGDGWHTRTRIELTTNDKGQAGMFAYRSRNHIPLQTMPLAHKNLEELELFTTVWPANSRLSALAPTADAPMILIDGLAPEGHPGTVWERVLGYEYLIDANGFWQAHMRAPETLIQAVTAAIGTASGATIFDLFSGAGLLTLPIADAVGETGRVFSVEGNRRAVHRAQENCESRRQVQTHHGDVEKVLRSDNLPSQADIVVLDPPRVGARAGVIEQIISRSPQKIVYVSCDPAALARDLGIAAENGYRAEQITAFDLFPHTHHIESIVVLEPEAA